MTLDEGQPRALIFSAERPLDSVLRCASHSLGVTWFGERCFCREFQAARPAMPTAWPYTGSLVPTAWPCGLSLY
jgi:hypothetical protein